MATLEDYLREWTLSESYERDTLTYKADVPDVIDTASIIWPDGSTGTFTTTAFVTVDYANLPTGFTITYDETELIVIQQDRTLNALGIVLVEPQLLITSSDTGFGVTPFGAQPYGV